MKRYIYTSQPFNSPRCVFHVKDYYQYKDSFTGSGTPVGTFQPDPVNQWITGIYVPTSSYIQYSDANLPKGSSARAMSMWFKSDFVVGSGYVGWGPNADTAQVIEYGDPNNTGAAWRPYVMKTIIGLALQGAFISFDIGFDITGTWHHIVWQIDANQPLNQVQIYLDGNLLTTVYSSVNDTIVLNTGVSDLELGYFVVDNKDMDFSYANLRFFDGILSPEQIKQLGIVDAPRLAGTAKR